MGLATHSLICVAITLLINNIAFSQVTFDWADVETLLTKATVLGVEHDALVDTGSSSVSIDQVVATQILGEREWRSVPVRTIDGSRISREYLNVPVTLADFPQRMSVVTTNPDVWRSAHLYGRDIHFIVGMPLLKDRVLAFHSGRAELTDPVPSSADLRPQYLISFLKSEVPKCLCRPGGISDKWFIVDTGGDAPLVVDSEMANLLCDTGEAIRVLEKGQRGEWTAGLIVIREVELWGIKHYNVPAATGGINVVGFGLLRHMTFTLDFPNKRVLVPDPAQPGRDWFPIDASGLRIVRKEDRLTRIRRIVENSTGDEAGVKLDDVIVAVNGTPALEMSRYEVEEVLSKPGTTVHLDIERNGKSLAIDVPLEHPFEYPPKWPPRPEPSQDQLDFEKFLEEQNASKAPEKSASQPKPE